MGISQAIWMAAGTRAELEEWNNSQVIAIPNKQSPNRVEVISSPWDLFEGYHGVLEAITAIGGQISPRLSVSSDTWQTLPGAVTLRAINRLRTLRRGGMHIVDISTVSKYLVRHPDMLDPLDKVLNQAHHIFNRAACFYLQVYQDHEAGLDYLVLYVRQPEYDGEFTAKLESMWALVGPEFADTSGWLLVTTDFRSPTD